MAIELTSTELILIPQQNRIEVGFGHAIFLARNRHYSDARKMGLVTLELVDHVESVDSELALLKSDLQELGINDLSVDTFATEMRRQIEEKPELAEQGTLRTIGDYLSKDSDDLRKRAVEAQISATSFLEKSLFEEWEQAKIQADALTIQAIQSRQASKGRERIFQTIANLAEKGVLDPTLAEFLQSLDSVSVVHIPIPPEMVEEFMGISEGLKEKELNESESEVNAQDDEQSERNIKLSKSSNRPEGIKPGERPALLVHTGFGFSKEHFPLTRKELINIVWEGKLTSTDTLTRTAIDIADLLTTDKKFRGQTFEDLKQALLSHPVVANMSREEIISVLTRDEGERFWADDFDQAQERGLEQQKLDQIFNLLEELPTDHNRVLVQIGGKEVKLVPEDIILLIVLNKYAGKQILTSKLVKEALKMEAKEAGFSTRKARLEEILNQKGQSIELEGSGPIGPVNSWCKLNHPVEVRVVKTGQILDLATWELKEETVAEVATKDDYEEQTDQTPGVATDKGENKDKKESTKRGEQSIRAFKLAFGLEGELIEEYDNLVLETWKHLIGNKKTPSSTSIVSNYRTQTHESSNRLLNKIKLTEEQLKDSNTPHLVRKFIAQVRVDYPYILEFTPAELEKIIRRQEGGLNILRQAKERFEAQKATSLVDSKQEAVDQPAEELFLPAEEIKRLMEQEDLLPAEEDHASRTLRVRTLGRKREFPYPSLENYIRTKYASDLGTRKRPESERQEIYNMKLTEVKTRIESMMTKLFESKEREKDGNPLHKPAINKVLRLINAEPILTVAFDLDLELIRKVFACEISYHQLKAAVADGLTKDLQNVQQTSDQ